MKKILSMIIVLVILTAGVAAYATYEEETNVIDYELVLEMNKLGMTPDLRIDEDGMVWTAECTLDEMNKLCETDDLQGDAMVYMWYDVYNNIGSLTVAGTIEDPDSDEVIHFIQLIFRWDDDYSEFYGADDLTDTELAW